MALFLIKNRVSKQKIELTLPADLKYSSLLRQISEAFFLYAGFTKEWSGRLKLVVDELFMNAIRYGSKSEGSLVHMSYQFDNDEISYRIEDEGGGDKKVIAEELKKVIHRNSDEANILNKTSGRGLALISSLWTDSMVVEDSQYGGIAVTFSKKISSENPPAPSPSVHETRVFPQAVTETGKLSPVVLKGPTEVIRISGEIDQSNLEKKTELITETVTRLPVESTLVLDCRELVYINSTFIGHLAAWLNDIQAKNGQLVLRNTNKEIRDVLSLVGLSKVLYLES